MITNPSSIEILTDYAAGSLPLVHSLVCLSTHLERCPECQQQIKKTRKCWARTFDQAQKNRKVGQLSNLKGTASFKNLGESLFPKKVSIITNADASHSQWGRLLLSLSSLRHHYNKVTTDLTWLRLFTFF